jgi:hypothetical protein
MPGQKHTFRDRIFEVIPGLMFWGTVFFAVFFSFTHPAWVAIFIIIFDLYWLLKAINSALHLVSAYKRFRMFLRMNWFPYLERLTNFSTYIEYLDEQLKQSAHSKTAKKYFTEEVERIRTLVANGRTSADYRKLYHVVLYPFVDESYEVLESALRSLAQVDYPKDRIIAVLASEERAGRPAQETAHRIEQAFGHNFFKFFISVHPDGLEGEIKGKSANASWAMQSVVPELQKLGINLDDVIVSNFDSDTVTHPEYFSRVSYEYLTAEKPHRSSYQPIPVYNNNMWRSPALVRLVAVNSTFFQFIECSRPNRLRTFSSHSMSLKALMDVGYWRKDLINEDGYIFWQCYLKYEGDYRVIPLFISVSLDTCLDVTLKQTLINQYKQKRRWAYNVEYYPTIVPALLTSKAPFWDRMYKLWQYVEGDYNWATASVIITFLGYLPLYIGGAHFTQTVVALNLPLLTKVLMTAASVFLVASIYLNLLLLPPRPSDIPKWKNIYMLVQWIYTPIIALVFGSLPGIDAQTRLMFGKHMGFWVTPKPKVPDSGNPFLQKQTNIN